MDRVYVGKPPGDVVVEFRERSIGRPLRHRVRHSPTGFRWGFNGSGPTDLALSILWDHLGAEPAPSVVVTFRSAYVAGWATEASWELAGDELARWLEELHRRLGTPLTRAEAEWAS